METVIDELFLTKMLVISTTGMIRWDRRTSTWSSARWPTFFYLRFWVVRWLICSLNWEMESSGKGVRNSNLAIGISVKNSAGSFSWFCCRGNFLKECQNYPGRRTKFFMHACRNSESSILWDLRNCFMYPKRVSHLRFQHLWNAYQCVADQIIYCLSLRLSVYRTT